MTGRKHWSGREPQPHQAFKLADWLFAVLSEASASLLQDVGLFLRKCNRVSEHSAAS